MEPLHQLHSSTYEVMYPYKVHYQNCPFSENRKEFPSKNDRDDSSWKQSQPSVNLPVLKSPACSSDSTEGYENEKTMIERERTIITENEWAMRVMQSNQMKDVFRWVEGYRIQVANVITEIERLREHNTLLRDKAHDKIRWHEGEMKKMGLGMVTSFYLFVHIINVFFYAVIDDRQEEMGAREWRLEGRLAFLDLLLHMDRSRTIVSALRKHRSSVSSRKCVRFADSLGHDLEKMEYFTRDEENLFSHRVVSHRLFPTNFVYRSESEFQPNSIGPREYFIVEDDSCRPSHGTNQCILNLVYDKKIKIQHTMDGWLTHFELPASFSHKLFGNEDIDAFSSVLAIPHKPQGEKKSDSPDGERRGRGKKKEWKGVVSDDSDRSLSSQRDGKSPVKKSKSQKMDSDASEEELRIKRKEKEAKKASLAVDSAFGKEDSSSDSSSSKSTSPNKEDLAANRLVQCLEELKLARLSRFKLARFVHAPFFNKTMIDCYVRMGIAQVIDVVEAAKVITWSQRKLINNQEFQEWMSTMKRHNRSLPTMGEIH
ncbi:hypothetical protein PRIPAC_94156 [Pristionchus pacificus]|uniref:Plus3 domain-containing protein n=1 Tax=Pristionchus pacificus TaxID=54126 RepID=A0A2A6CHR3_PRIPA|nr:hypothetical protein PRIPAC_94156 [Pristionchus pacificus]|eukprot:PDM77742.1 hypothetical protein PRIPAC_34609 [Pristionchus pacificus]